MEDRAILHVDFNAFFPSVEELLHPELRNVPMAVTGNPRLRHGVILSANRHAKAAGIKAAQTIKEAQALCPDVVTVIADVDDMDRYYPYSEGLLDICAKYTSLVASGGVDEAYLDVSASGRDGTDIADEIRQRTLDELGLSTSVGVSWCRAFAKVASDLRKPNATTVISRTNYRDVVWPLPTSVLLGVGMATQIKLYHYNMLTVGDLAAADRGLLGAILGRNGDALWKAANGLDDTPVTHISSAPPPGSVGNSTTCPRDISTRREALVTFYKMAENIEARLRTRGYGAKAVHAGIRGTDLSWIVHQTTLDYPTQSYGDILTAAMGIYDASHTSGTKIRGLALYCTGLVDIKRDPQMSFLPVGLGDPAKTARDEQARAKMQPLLLQYPDLAGVSFRTDRKAIDKYQPR